MSNQQLDPHRDVSFPTENDEHDWIYCEDESGKQAGKVPGQNAGKWLIFVPVKFIDAIWYSVCCATRKGDLGFSSKVSTVKDNDEYEESTKVICVYTYDWTDEVDVMRVRSALRRIGLTHSLSYKTDADTRAGKYSHLGHKRIAKYFM